MSGLMFTRDQVVELLQVAATYDRRTIGDADVVAWAHAAKHGRWGVLVDGPDGGKVLSNHVAMEAIRHHFAMSTAYLMPAHITAYVVDWRRRPPPPVTAAGLLEAARPATEKARKEAIELFAKRFKPPGDAA